MGVTIICMGGHPNTHTHTVKSAMHVYIVSYKLRKKQEFTKMLSCLCNHPYELPKKFIMNAF